MKRNRLIILSALLISQIVGGYVVFAHQSHKPAEKAKPHMHGEEEVEKKIFSQINDAYKTNIKPIFQKKCFDCHSNQTQFPWYSGIPGVKQFITSDIEEARKHLDFSNDFPFQGHGTPLEDLEAIKKSIEEGSMPPWRYRILHSGTKVSTHERAAIEKWVSESKKLIR